jgi:hypothetical protein
MRAWRRDRDFVVPPEKINNTGEDVSSAYASPMV